MKIRHYAASFMFIIIILTLWVPYLPTSAQSSTPTCTQFLTDIEKHLSADCANMNQNESCYGNNVIGVQFQQPDAQLSFAKLGDIIPVEVIKSIQTGPLNLERNEWGI